MSKEQNTFQYSKLIKNLSNMLGHKDNSVILQKYTRYFKRKDKKRVIFLHQ